MIVHRVSIVNLTLFMLQAGEGWGVPSGRRLVNPAYDNVFEVQLNAIK